MIEAYLKNEIKELRKSLRYAKVMANSKDKLMQKEWEKEVNNLSIRLKENQKILRLIK